MARYPQGRAIILLMTLANMRENGVGSVVATCAKCRHEGVLDVQRWPADEPVPDIGLKLRSSACGGRDIDTRPRVRAGRAADVVNAGWFCPALSIA
jgi:hypothetical protein